jgi:hypothetical protein
MTLQIVKSSFLTRLGAVENLALAIALVSRWVFAAMACAKSKIHELLKKS